MAQVLICGWLFWDLLTCVQLAGFNTVGCLNPTPTTSKLGRRIATNYWYFHLLKYIDLLETVFFVLRGNIHQVGTIYVICY